MRTHFTNIEAALQNTFLTYLPNLTFEILGQECQLIYMTNCPDFTPSLAVSIQANNENILLELSNLDILNLHQDLKDINQFDSLPQELMQAVLEHICADNMKHLNNFLDIPLSFLSAQAEESSSFLYFKLEFNNTFSLMKIYFPKIFSMNLINKLNKLTPIAQNASSLELDISIEIGSLSLSFEELKKLELEDILLPQNLVKIENNSNIHLKIIGNENLDYLCNIQDNNVVILKQIIEEKNMDNENFSLENLELNISFELERRKMSIKEIQELQVGSNILLDTDNNSPVTIRVNDKAFALGTIIEIDNKNAVQITKIL